MPRHLTTIDTSGFVSNTQLGVASGVATLGTDGKIPTSQLPPASGTFVPQTGASDAFFSAPATTYGVPGPVVQDVVTGLMYRLRVRNGVVEAVLASRLLPVTPVALGATATVNAVRLAWTAGTGGGAQDGFNVYRNGALLTYVTTRSYSDYSVVDDSAYTYQVTAVNAIGESAKSASATATPTASLNLPPTTPTITLWPPVLPTSGTCVVHINASEPDSQNLTFGLTVSAGTLTATEDPSVYIYTAP